MNRALLCFTCSLALLSVFGCGGKAPKILPVKGTIQLAGVDLKGLQVIFSPKITASKNGETPTVGTAAVGTIAADGTFQLSTTKPNDGAAVGKYVAMIGPPSAAPGDTSIDLNRLKGIPETYLDAALSPLEAEVKESGSNDFKWQLDPKGRQSTDSTSLSTSKP